MRDISNVDNFTKNVLGMYCNSMLFTQVYQKVMSGYRLPPPPGCTHTIYDLMIKCW